MRTIIKDAFATRLPDEGEIRNAKQLHKLVATQMQSSAETQISLMTDHGPSDAVALSPALAASLMDVLQLVSSGRSFRMIAADSELTTQQAADCLNVSRPFLIKLLEDGAIPHSKTGSHRKIKASNLFAYKEKRDDQRAVALDALAQLDAEADLL